MWWAIVTLTSEGYGDHVPRSGEGKVVGVLTMFAGLICLSLPITIIGQKFLEEFWKEDRTRQKAKKHFEAAGLLSSKQVQKPQREQDVDAIVNVLLEAHMKYHRKIREQLRLNRIKLLTQVNPDYKDPEEHLLDESGLKDRISNPNKRLSDPEVDAKKVTMNLKKAMKKGLNSSQSGADGSVAEHADEGADTVQPVVEELPVEELGTGTGSGSAEMNPPRPSSRQAWSEGGLEVSADAPAARAPNQLSPLVHKVDYENTEL